MLRAHTAITIDTLRWLPCGHLHQASTAVALRRYTAIAADCCPVPVCVASQQAVVNTYIYAEMELESGADMHSHVGMSAYVRPGYSGLLMSATSMHISR